MIVGVEAVQIAENIAAGVADLQIGVAQLLQDGLGQAHILRVVCGGDPQAQDVRAVVLDGVLGADGVAQGLVHDLALDRPRSSRG